MAVEPSVTRMLDDLEEIYRKAGVPIPEKHKQVASQLLLEIPPERRVRVPTTANGRWYRGNGRVRPKQKGW